MNIAKRMKKLKALLDVRIGPGAAILSSDIKRIHLDFARKINDGHFGARKVWRTYFPRLKYHNPAISMTVNRTVDQEGPATLSIFFASPKYLSATASSTHSSSKEPSTVPARYNVSDKVMTVHIKHKHESEILSQLLELTKGIPYDITPEEQGELRQVEDNKRSSERDREAQARLNEVRKQEKALLDQARGNAAEAA